MNHPRMPRTLWPGCPSKEPTMTTYQPRFVMLLTIAALIVASLCAARSACQTDQAKQGTADVETMIGLIKELGDDSFTKREAADKRLAEIGEPALELLRKAAQDNPDPEVRQRAEQLVRQIGTTLFPEVRRFEAHVGAAEGRPWATRLAITPDGKQVVSAG